MFGTETNYQNARLRVGESSWDRISPGDVVSGYSDIDNGIETTNNTIRWSAAEFTFAGGGDDFDGDYTIGDPANVLDLEYYQTVSSGDWRTPAVWQAADNPNFTGPSVTASAGPPCEGAVVFIRDGHQIQMDPTPDGTFLDGDNNVQLTYMIIEQNGALYVDTTVGHSFSKIEGNGRIRVANTGGKIPGGDMTTTPVYAIPAYVSTGSEFTFLDENEGGTLEFSGSAIDYSFSADARMSNVYNLEFTGSGTRRFGLQDITINGNLTIGDGNTVVVEQDNTTIRLKGDLIKNDNGDELRVNAEDYPSSSVIFEGTANQLLTGEFTGSGSLYNVEFNNTSGITINSGYVDVDEQIRMSSGIVSVSGHELNTITPNEGTIGENPVNALRLNIFAEINGGSTGQTDVTNFNDSKYIDGPFCRELLPGTGEYLMPLGDINPPFFGNTYGPMAIVNPSVGQRYWCAQYFIEEPINPFVICAASPDIVKTSTIEHWWVEDQPTGGTTRVKLYWGPHSNVKSQTNNLRIVDYDDPSLNNDEWCDIGITEGPVGIATGTGYVVSGDEGFSDHFVTFATIDFENTPLPVELISFNGLLRDNVIELSWLTASEINNSHFELEKSVDGFNFTLLERVEATGSNARATNYVSIDTDPKEGVNYYRLKQVDLDGTTTFSEVIAIKYEVDQFAINEAKTVLVYPNPTDGGGFNIRLEGFQQVDQLKIQVFDMLGREVYQQTSATFNRSFYDEAINDLIQLKSGIYIVKVSDGLSEYNKRVMIR